MNIYLTIESGGKTRAFKNKDDAENYIRQRAEDIIKEMNGKRDLELLEFRCNNSNDLYLSVYFKDEADWKTKEYATLYTLERTLE